MQLGIKNDDKFISCINSRYNNIQRLFLKKIIELTKASFKKVMLSDNTINNLKTFDPQLTYKFFLKFKNELDEFIVDDVFMTNDNDVRRIFLKIQITENNYVLLGNFSLQYHVLLYYKPCNDVSKYQNSLNILTTKSDLAKNEFSKKGNEITLNKLNKLGYNSLTNEKLFEIFFNNPKLSNEIYNDVVNKQNTNNILINKEKELLKNLDKLLIEVYTTTSTLINNLNLIAGEEGCSCEFYLNHVTNKIINLKKMPLKIKNKLVRKLDKFIEIMMSNI